MSPQTLALAATIGAIWSAGWNYAAFGATPHRGLRAAFGVNVAFSLVFALAWAWVAVDPTLNRARWSEAVAPFSLLSFWTVWSSAAIFHYAHRQRDVS